ncbi:DUF2339 domain-containing protein [Adhaeribacter soli]|uniref:DUF2339 domain-containing protein n=1 Tax=Adhaeribacter soli TaxID=2607655 RepID=A0A5N1J300_9BACT|nr:DUF2339 domain-containing protein [Adhaeribacter soli]KAA9339012.1 DUF2339 domain-containing protein [Adhaeribacter soli]
MAFLFIIAIVVAAYMIVNALSGKIQEIHFRFDAQNRELQRIREELEKVSENLKTRPQAPPPVAPEVRPAAAPKDQTAPIPPAPVRPESPLEEARRIAAFKAPEPEKTVPLAPEKPMVEERVPAAPAMAFSPPAGAGSFGPPAEPVTPEEPELTIMERFRQNNPDLEKFIGENLINKIGIAILVLGIGYFVKFAIDKDWINEIGRVCIGILAGGLLIGVAHYLRKTFTAFSSVLVGGGLAVLYFTIAIAFHEYHLLSQTAAFLVMVVITGFSVLLSVSYNRIELAVLALLGGFVTPFMVSTGEGNYQVLFTYILVLNVGMLALAYLKGWKLLNWISYAFTVLLFGGWLSTKVFNATHAPYLGALLFASLFYLVFFLMNIIYNLKERTRFAPVDFSILLSNTFFYYAAGMGLLANVQQGLYQGIFTVAIGLFNFGFAFYFFRRGHTDRNLIYLLIGLVITFISLAVPVQLEGNYITMFWALEAVLLLWLAQRSGLKIIYTGSFVVTGLMLISLLMDWNNVYMAYAPGTSLRILLNKGFITSLLAGISLWVTSRLLRHETSPLVLGRYEFNLTYYQRFLFISLALVTYISLLLELQYQLKVFVSSGFSRSLILGTYNLAFMLGLLVYAEWKNALKLTSWALAFGALGIILYVSVYNTYVYQLLRARLLYQEPGFAGFPFHYLNLLLTIGIMILGYRQKPLLETVWPSSAKFLAWSFSVLVVFMASSELLFHVLWLKMPEAGVGQINLPTVANELAERWHSLVRQTSKVGFPILWGICAFVFMFIGLARKNQQLRIFSLSLFAFTLAKLFLYDIRGISEGGKIAAFIFLGVVLLVVSFMYQKIKTLILKDDKTGETEGAA